MLDELIFTDEAAVAGVPVPFLTLNTIAPTLMKLATAKFWAAEAGHRVAHTAVHVHGGVGIDRDYPLHRYFVAAKRNEFGSAGPPSTCAGWARRSRTNRPDRGRRVQTHTGPLWNSPGAFVIVP